MWESCGFSSIKPLSFADMHISCVAVGMMMSRKIDSMQKRGRRRIVEESAPISFPSRPMPFPSGCKCFVTCFMLKCLDKSEYAIGSAEVLSGHQQAMSYILYVSFSRLSMVPFLSFPLFLAHLSRAIPSQSYPFCPQIFLQHLPFPNFPDSKR